MGVRGSFYKDKFKYKMFNLNYVEKTRRTYSFLLVYKHFKIHQLYTSIGVEFDKLPPFKMFIYLKVLEYVYSSDNWLTVQCIVHDGLYDENK